MRSDAVPNVPVVVWQLNDELTADRATFGFETAVVELLRMSVANVPALICWVNLEVGLANTTVVIPKLITDKPIAIPATARFILLSIAFCIGFICVWLLY